MARTVSLHLCLAAALLAVACGPTKAPAPAGTTPASSAERVYVDVRTAEEFNSGHVSGAVNIPHDQMQARWTELAAYKDTPVVLYCRSGRRSGLALEVLRKQGFTHVENAGGLDQLAARGVPVSK
jgi:phage shock protein E